MAKGGVDANGGSTRTHGVRAAMLRVRGETCVEHAAQHSENASRPAGHIWYYLAEFTPTTANATSRQALARFFMAADAFFRVRTQHRESSVTCRGLIDGISIGYMTEIRST